MDAAWLIQIIEASGAEIRSYSGRGMSGKECVGAVTNGSLLGFLADIAEECENAHDAATIIRAARTDDMGRGTIVYWPHAEWPEDRGNDRRVRGLSRPWWIL